jgi:hypothetical protein
MTTCKHWWLMGDTKVDRESEKHAMDMTKGVCKKCGEGRTFRSKSPLIGSAPPRSAYRRKRVPNG